jgi:hypothetical protein
MLRAGLRRLVFIASTPEESSMTAALSARASLKLAAYQPLAQKGEKRK